MWATIAAVSSAAVSAGISEQQRQYRKAGEDALKLMAEAYGTPIGRTIGRPRIVSPSKCPGCGSHEFRNHHGKQVCSYCRIEATYDQD